MNDTVKATQSAVEKMSGKAVLPTSDSLAVLKGLVDLQVLLEARKKTLEETLKTISGELKEVSQGSIPDLLAQYGLSEIKLKDGRKVIVKTDVSVTIKDFDQFYDFLKSRKDDAIVKSITEVIEPSKEVLIFLNENEIDFTTASKINAQTLKAYFREFMSLGETVPESVNVYVYSKTKIK